MTHGHESWSDDGVHAQSFTQPNWDDAQVNRGGWGDYEEVQVELDV